MVHVEWINGLGITLALIMPYQTAECELGFSYQNSIKTSHCNNVKEKHLNLSMTINTSKCSVADFDYELAVNMWKEKKAHRIYKNESHQ